MIIKNSIRAKDLTKKYYDEVKDMDDVFSDFIQI